MLIRRKQCNGAFIPNNPGVPNQAPTSIHPASAEDTPCMVVLSDSIAALEPFSKLDVMLCFNHAAHALSNTTSMRCADSPTECNGAEVEVMC